MNRREKRRMSKKMGILQYQQKLSRNKKFELFRENIIVGHRREQEIKEEVRRQQNLSNDERESENIQLLAEQLSQSEKIPLIDALEIVQNQFKKGQK